MKKQQPVKQKAITDVIKTFSNVLKNQGIKKVDFDASCNGLTKDEIAYRKLKLIAKALNEGWQPDWQNSDQYKYYPYFKIADGFSLDDFGLLYQFSGVGSRLCFKSGDLALYAGEQFLSIYKDYFTK